MDNWILVPCSSTRLSELFRLLHSLKHRADHVVVVTTQPNPIQIDDMFDLTEHVVLFNSTEINISKWWNLGLDYISKLAEQEHEVLCLTSDYVGDTYSVCKLSDFLRSYNLAMAGPGHHFPQHRIFNLHDVRTPPERVPGACWMLAGETKLRADEEFRWWYSDDDLEMQARRYSAVGVVPGTALVSTAGDTPLDEKRAIWAQEDRQKFIRKWGKEPW